MHLTKCHIREQRLHHVLAVVERALERDVVHVGVEDRCHLPALHLGYASRGVQHVDVEVGAATAGLDRGRAGVTRGRDDDRRTLAPASELAVHEAPDQLQGDVLERERRPVEQLEQPRVVGQLHERAHGVVAERRVGVETRLGEVVAVDAVDERPDHRSSRLGIRRGSP